MKTAVYDFFKSAHFVFDTKDPKLKFESDLKNIIYNRLVEPELNRIFNHTEKDIKGYDKGGYRFNLMPTLNTLTNKNGVPAITFLQGEKTEALKEQFKSEFFDVMTAEIEAIIQKEVDGNLETVDNYNKENKNNISVDHINDSKYKAGKKYPSFEMGRRAAELDYVINSTIHNMNVMQMIAGDPATYFTKGDPTSTDAKEQFNMSKDLGVNMGKRLAMMIAPGITLAEATENYIQIALDDDFVVAPNIETIIDIHYGKETLNDTFINSVGVVTSYADVLLNLRGGVYKNLEKGDKRLQDLKQLNLKYNNISAFLQIESTDGQEYTTLNEHLRVMKGLGRMSTAEIKEINRKIDAKERLSKADLDLLLQPMKPVYTGSTMEDGIMRVTYIKCSAFPLIPDLVNGTELEPLMNKLNDIAEKYKDSEGVPKGVRASYQSANKVGANLNTINPLDQDSLDTLDESNDGSSPTASVTLNRANFKIQQDVPFKSDKIGDDKVSMGTQIFKLLLGDGVAQIIDSNIPEGEKGIQERYFDSFSTMVEITKETLLDELGLDGKFKSRNPAETAEKIKDILLREAEDRNFSQNDLNMLKIAHKTVKGKTIYYFKQPLWMSGNSDKIETMFNAIVNNRIFKQKLPGNASVVGSNSGLTTKLQSNMNNTQKNSVIHIGDYKGGILKGNEVLAPSKFKVDGKILDLYKKDENDNYIYIVENAQGGYSINEKMLDPALLENFTFRTPTSSHGSGSTINIVGFLPDTMGDLMITPSNFVAQMGQDFDIDKLTNYQYHHYTDVDGKIKKLDQKHIDYLINKAEKALEKVEAAATEQQQLEAMEILDNLDIEIDGEDRMTAPTELVNYDERITKAKEKLKGLPAKLRMKMVQNEFIAIHNEVYNNTSKDIQKKIHKVLSMDTATEQAEAIDDKITANENDFGLSLLSPTYQMNKLISGSTGGDAIGIYAKGVTFNSLAQQAKARLRLKRVE